MEDAAADKPRMERCEDQNRTFFYIRAVKVHSYGVALNPNLFSLKQIPLNWKEHMFHTGSSSNFE